MRVIERGASEREFGGIRRKLKISWWKLLTQGKCIYIMSTYLICSLTLSYHISPHFRLYI